MAIQCTLMSLSFPGWFLVINIMPVDKVADSDTTTPDALAFPETAVAFPIRKAFGNATGNVICVLPSAVILEAAPHCTIVPPGSLK